MLVVVVVFSMYTYGKQYTYLKFENSFFTFVFINSSKNLYLSLMFLDIYRYEISRGFILFNLFLYI